MLLVATAVFILPSAESSSTLGSSGRLALSEETAISECMRVKGHKYEVSVPMHARVDDALVAADKENRSFEAAFERITEEYPGDPNEAAYLSLPPEVKTAWSSALDGAQGCRTQVLATTQERMNDKVDAQLEAADLTLDELVPHIESQPEVAAAEAAYFTCMTARGYELTTMTDVFRQYGPDGDLTTPDTDAILTARMDAYAAHDDCAEPYNSAYNTEQREVFGADE